MSQEEYKSVRSSSGFIDLSHRGKLQLSGRDRLSYMDRMVTNRVVDLQEGDGVYALLLDLKGRVVADMRIYSLASFLWIELDEVLVEKVEQILTSHRFMADVPIKNITKDWALFSCQGPSSKEVLGDLFGTSLSSLGNLKGASVVWNKERVLIMCVDRTGSGGYDLFIEKEGANALSTALSERMPTFGLDTLEILRVEAGIPRYGNEFDETILALDSSLKDSAIHYQKGCYMGQEIIIRIHSRGKINRSMQGLTSEDPVPKGKPVYQGEKQVGKITSSSFSPYLKKNIALAILRKDSQNSQNPLFMYANHESENRSENQETEKEIIRLELVDLPFCPSFPESSLEKKG